MTKTFSRATIATTTHLFGGPVDRKGKLHYMPETQTIQDLRGRIEPVGVSSSEVPFIFQLAIEVAVHRYNQVVSELSEIREFDDLLPN